MSSHGRDISWEIRSGLAVWPRFLYRSAVSHEVSTSLSAGADKLGMYSGGQYSNWSGETGRLEQGNLTPFSNTDIFVLGWMAMLLQLAAAVHSVAGKSPWMLCNSSSIHLLLTWQSLNPQLPCTRYTDLYWWHICSFLLCLGLLEKPDLTVPDAFSWSLLESTWFNLEEWEWSLCRWILFCQCTTYWARDRLPSKALAVTSRVEELSSAVRKDNQAILK